jgi:hypothetical protein
MNILLCNYPRSGTNWVGVVLHDLISTRDLNSQNHFHDLDILQKLTGVEYEKMLHNLNSTPNLVLKTHRLPADLNERDFSYLTDCLFIQIIRNPVDIAVSYFNFMIKHKKVKSKTFQEALDSGDLLSFLNQFELHHGIPGMCSWGDHLSNWRSFLSNKSHGFITYDDLVKNPNAFFSLICQYSSIDVSHEVIHDTLKSRSKTSINTLFGGGFVLSEESMDHSRYVPAELLKKYHESFGPFPPASLVSPNFIN